MDGVDAAMLMTDGQKIHAFGDSYFRPYSGAEQETIAAAQGLWPDEDPSVLEAVEKVVREAHAEVMSDPNKTKEDMDKWMAENKARFESA